MNRTVPLCLDRSEIFLTFESELKRRVIGQEQAVKAVSEIYQLITVGLTPLRRPMASFLLLGPSGVGKTLLVETVADILFREPTALIKISCAEYQESHEIAKILGAPPGYIGHRESFPLITDYKLKRYHTEKHPFSLLLFDEIEKAHSALWDLLLGILDKGELTISNNENVDLSKVIIFMTSNLGAFEISNTVSGQSLGFNPFTTDDTIKTIDKISQQAARKNFSPEFINRIDKIVVFQPLQPEHLEKIFDLEVEILQNKLVAASHFCELNFSSTARQTLISKGFDKRYGARNLRRVLEQEILYPVANFIATKQIENATRIHIDYSEQKFSFTKEIQEMETSKVEELAKVNEA